MLNWLSRCSTYDGVTHGRDNCQLAAEEETTPAPAAPRGEAADAEADNWLSGGDDWL